MPVIGSEEDDVELIVGYHGKLETLKAPWNHTFQEIADLVLPNRSHMTTQRSQGAQVYGQIYDATAPWANETLASGLNSLLTSQVQRWFRICLVKHYYELEQDEEVRRWLERVTEIMYHVLNSQASNFQTQSHEMYLDLPAFGTGVMYMDEVPGGAAPIRFQCFPLNEICIDENEWGVVDTVYRKFQFTARKAMLKWGDRLPSKFAENAAKNPYESHYFLHAVQPNRKFDPTRPKFSNNKPWSSVYVYPQEKIILSQGGYDYNPYIVPRWAKMAGEVYGRSPSMIALPTIRMLNEMKKTVLQAGQQVVRPPLQLPDEGFLLPIKQQPGGLNYYNASTVGEGRIEPIQTGGRVDIGMDMMSAEQQHIVRCYYLDWLQMQKNDVEMTATESMARDDENKRLMTPMLSRLESEWLDRLISNTYYTCDKFGMFPPKPAALQGIPLDVAYVSPAARSQKATQAFGFAQMMQMVSPIAQVKPKILDRLNGDKMFEWLATLGDVPMDILFTEEQMQAAREEEAEALRAQQAAETAATGAGAVSELSKAQLNAAKAEQASNVTPIRRTGLA